MNYVPAMVVLTLLAVVETVGWVLLAIGLGAI